MVSRFILRMSRTMEPMVISGSPTQVFQSLFRILMVTGADRLTLRASRADLYRWNWVKIEERFKVSFACWYEIAPAIWPMLSKITCWDSVIKRNSEKSSNIQTMRNGLDRRIISSSLSFAQVESQILPGPLLDYGLVFQIEVGPS